MTKPIKFRAWDKESLTLTKVNALFFKDHGVHKVFTQTSSAEDDGVTYDDSVLMQFTGLLDKSNREIFEGDVLHYEARGYVFNGEVVFNDGAYALKRGARTYELCEAAIRSCDVMEIIGNIYENPELLTQ